MLFSIIKSLGFVILLIIILSITNHFLMNAIGYKIPDFSRGYFCGFDIYTKVGSCDVVQTSQNESGDPVYKLVFSHFAHNSNK